MEELIYKGFIKEASKGENDDALFIGEMDEPIAEVFENKIQGKQVSVRYWISDAEKTKQELQESFLKMLFGVVDAEYGDAYSEISGYLYTNEELKVGGHDLLSELKYNIGKFILLEIDIH